MEDKFDPKFVMELLKRLPVQIFWKDINGVYLGCNDAFVHSLGLSSQNEIIGKTDFTLPVKIKEAEVYRKDDLEVIKTNQPKLNIEEEQTFSGGKKVYLLTNKVPLSIENNSVNGILGIYSDITELKLIQQQLKLEKEKAEIANKSKSEFIANMSHDLRTPITGMLGMMQDMINTANEAASSLNDKKMPQDSQTLKTMIETVQRDSQFLMGATDELLQLCNEILEVVSLESGKLDNNVESFSLHDLIDHNIQLLQPIAHHKKLQLAYDIDQQVPPHLSGHRIYLDRVLLNLMSNALKFTEEGSVTISVIALDENGTDRQLSDTTTIQISVEDTGIGIPEDKFDIIFEHFSRLTPAYEGLYKGAGLGLYTVKRYVEAMEGTLNIESELGQGTCFTVTVPFAVADHANRAKQSVRFPKMVKLAADKNLLNQQESISAKKASILIVEDQSLAAYAITLALKPFNCHIETAENGKKAVKMAQEGDYDLILMDIGLPDFSGIEVAKKIRAFINPKKSQVPIIALTGHASNPEMRQEAIDAGMQNVMSKPAQPLVLESILQNYVFKAEKKK